MPNHRDDSFELIALWQRTSKAGNVYYHGPFTRNTDIIMFENSNWTEGGKQPKFRLRIKERDWDKKQQDLPAKTSHEDDPPPF